MQLHRLKHFLGLSFQFWLPLLVTGGAFWVASGWFTKQVLSQTYAATTQIDTTGVQQVTISFSATVLSIDAEIDRQSNMTEVNIQTSGSSLQEMEFEYPLTAYADLEQAIAQDLGLQPSDVRNLIRYRIN